MSSLKAFLNPVKVENKEVIISDRFVEDGKPVPFIIRPVTQEENEEILRRFRKTTKKGKDVQETFDQIGYSHELAATAVVFPNLNDADLQKAYGVLGGTKLLKKMLLIGEFAALAEEVRSLSGLEEDINDDIEEAKN
ncbi:phage tail assembly chaperone [Lacrimispora saccharolytica]|uniref:XkdN-like protein n=1 Tax=Lacrimispora saccharolytica (strain ATCC 35040 / DSM 2544 / NRCC 2533 / WM1) TaxID=610130 RepID=D9R928_LACSW|nr:phage portal protein [Lacrimispora saccharolytica]ADL04003.1 XkdN-like protein [[Clostridium] saccharolyticum WM1]QRV21695.1 phage portal protein [Lacrimispora saccharolytica]